MEHLPSSNPQTPRNGLAPSGAHDKNTASSSEPRRTLELLFEAHNFLHQALNTISDLAPCSYKAAFYAEAAQVWAEAGAADVARNLFSRSHSVTADLPAWDRFDAWEKLAAVYYELGDHQLKQAAIAGMFEALSEIEEPDSRAELLCNLTRTLVDIDDPAGALAALKALEGAYEGRPSGDRWETALVNGVRAEAFRREYASAFRLLLRSQLPSTRIIAISKLSEYLSVRSDTISPLITGLTQELDSCVARLPEDEQHFLTMACDSYVYLGCLEKAQKLAVQISDHSPDALLELGEAQLVADLYSQAFETANLIEEPWAAATLRFKLGLESLRRKESKAEFILELAEQELSRAEIHLEDSVHKLCGLAKEFHTHDFPVWRTKILSGTLEAISRMEDLLEGAASAQTLAETALQLGEDALHSRASSLFDALNTEAARRHEETDEDDEEEEEESSSGDSGLRDERPAEEDGPFTMARSGADPVGVLSKAVAQAARGSLAYRSIAGLPELTRLKEALTGAPQTQSEGLLKKLEFLERRYKSLGL